MHAILNRLRLGQRLATGFATIVLVMSIAAAVGIWRLSSLAQISKDLGGAVAERAMLARELHGVVQISAFRFETLALVDDQEFIKQIEADRKDTQVRSKAVRERLLELADTERSKQLMATIDSTGDAFRKARDGLFARKKAGEKLETAEIVAKLRPAAAAYAGAAEAYAQYQRERVAEAQAAAAASQREGVGMLASGVTLGVVLCVLLAWSLSRTILLPLSEASALARRVAQGDLQVLPIKTKGRDEVHAMLGELTEMQAKLGSLVGEVQQASDTIHHASSEIAAGNVDLSTRTEQTASNLQQAAASLEQLTGTVSQTADCARAANDLASAATQTASHGGTVITRMTATMDDINQSSKRIADIIGVIDGIAFQTNILALNAAVEAARAGEQGRGFAVVASEVRSLAQRSAGAAKEIKALISASVEKVASGTALVGQAGSAMHDIVQSVQRVSQTINDITVATAEQSTGIGQVSAAVSQLDGVTQQNAALVEEAAAAAESLKSQANRLAQVVSSLHTTAA